MPKLQVNDIELFYEIKGLGEPLLLIAGFLCDHSYWSQLMPSLTKQYQVIRLDNRGIGRSSAPNQPYSIEQMAKDAALLLDHLGIDKVHVIGHSMGGQIAQELALAHPEKVQSLILVSTWAKGDELFNSVIKSWGDLADKVDLKLYQQIVLPWIFSREFYSIPEMIEQLIEWAIHYPFPPTADGVYHQSRAIIAGDTSDRLPDIHCPTLVLVGRQDILTPVKFSQQLAQGIPNAQLVILDSGGHGFLIESREAAAKTILKFLSN